MKQNHTKKIVVFFIVIFFVLCCGLGGMAWYHGRQRGSEVIKSSQVSELPDSERSKPEDTSDEVEEDITSSENRAESEKNTAESKKDAQFSGKKIAFKNQIRDYGKLKDKQMEELREIFLGGKSKVKLYCKNGKVLPKMPVYQVKNLDIHSEAVQEDVYHVLQEAISNNPKKLSYQLQLVSGDALKPEEIENYMRGQSTETEPYNIIFPQDGQYFMLNKYNYDKRISVKDRYALTQKFACQRVKKLADKLVREMGAGCAPAEKKSWRIEGSMTKNPFDTLCYQNGILESYYAMQVPLSLGGFPLETDFGENPNDDGRIQAGAALQICYSESGLLSVYGNFPYAYVPTKKYYENLISLPKAQKSLEKFLEKKTPKIVAAGITHAELGYVVKQENEDRKAELRPVWALYGYEQCVGGGTCRFLVDAQNGKTYSEEIKKQ